MEFKLLDYVTITFLLLISTEKMLAHEQELTNNLQNTGHVNISELKGICIFYLQFDSSLCFQYEIM